MDHAIFHHSSTSSFFSSLKYTVHYLFYDFLLPSRGWRSSICRIGNVLNALFPSFLPQYIFPLSHPCLHYLHNITVMDRSRGHLPPTGTTHDFSLSDLTCPSIRLTCLPHLPCLLQVCASSESLTFLLMLARLSSWLPCIAQPDCLSILLARITLASVP